MQKGKDFLRDVGLALGLGLAIGAALVVAFAVIGGIANGLEGALEASRGAVLVVGGLLMVFSAILMLKGGNLPPDAFTLQPWKKQPTEDLESTEPLKLFRLLPRQYVFLLMAVGILTTSLIPESIVLYFL